jgi:hypothetical protein
MSTLGSVKLGDVSGKCAAIFEAEHSSSPLLKITATFFGQHQQGCGLCKRPVLAQQVAFEFLDALAVLPCGLRAGARLFGRGQRGSATRATCPARPVTRRARGTTRSRRLRSWPPW